MTGHVEINISANRRIEADYDVESSSFSHEFGTTREKHIVLGPVTVIDFVGDIPRVVTTEVDEDTLDLYENLLFKKAKSIYSAEAG